MNQNFIDTVHLFSCGARGLMPEANRPYDFEKIYHISKSQGIWETVFLAVSKLYEDNPQTLPKNTFEKLNAAFLMRCGKQCARYDFIHKLLKTFADNGIACCILKGESVARFYHTPVARISSDVDILINPKKLDLCLKIMNENGFHVGNKVYESHQVECTHPSIGLVEIHTMMYGRKTEDVCFNNEIKYDEAYLTVKAEDGTEYKTLGITDNFLFLLLHFIKHFLSAGAGIRQLEDVLLYVEHNYGQIDWDRANRALLNLGFQKFFACMIAIGKKYFDFPKDLMGENGIDTVLAEQIFEDMEQGGVFGHDDKLRQGFYELYLNERSKKRNGKSYAAYKNKRKFARLFPNRAFMAVNFPYVEKTALLLPVAWAHRIIKGILPPKKQNSASAQISRKHEERLKLMQDLGMI